MKTADVRKTKHAPRAEAPAVVQSFDRVEHAILHQHREARAAFAVEISVARFMWQRYPELVTSPEFPQFLQGWYEAVYGEGQKVEDTIAVGDDVLALDHLAGQFAMVRTWEHVKRVAS